MINNLNKMKLSISIQDVFDAPLLSDLALLIKPYRENDFQIPENLIPANCDAITPDMLPLLSITQEEINKILNHVVKGARNIQDIYPLSSLQEGILFHHLLNESFDTYILPSLFILKDKNRLNDLVNALQYVINRHDVLRTSIHWEGIEQAVQIVHKEVEFVAKEIKVDQTQDIKKQLLSKMELNKLYMDLSIAPLLKIEYVEDNNSNQCYVLFKLHHIISDHVSLELLIEEVTQYLSNQNMHLPTPLAYRDFIAYGLHKKNKYNEEVFFKDKLFDIDEPTLPFGLVDTYGDGTRIIEDRCMVPSMLSQKIRSVCLEQNVTPAAFFHMAFSIVISQLSSRNKVVFGTVLSGRYQGTADLNNMFGMFINTLPIRISLENNTVQALIKEVQQYLIDLLDYEQTSLAFAQSCSEVTKGSALFSATLNYRHSNTTKIKNTDIELVSSYERDNYPFNVMIDDYGKDFGLITQINHSINPQGINKYMLKVSEELVNSLEYSISNNISDISLLSKQDKQELLLD